MQTRLLKAVTAAIAALVVLSGSAWAQQSLRIGLVYVGPIGNAGWTFAHDTGRKSIEAKLKGKVRTTYVESVPEGADAERVIRDLASKGHQIIFTPSFGYMDQTLKVAKSFPKHSFYHATGYLFTGPIKGNDGSIKVPQGKTLTDKEVDAINWYVEGVEGKVPGK